MPEQNAVRRTVTPRVMLLFTAFGAFAILLVLLTAALSDGRIPSQDQTVLDWVRDVDLPGLGRASSVLSEVTDRPGAAIGGCAALAVLLITGRSRAAWRLGIVLAMAAIAVVIADATMGNIVGHTRPSGFEGGNSFPSGHVTGMTIVFGGLAYFLVSGGVRRARRAVLLGALVVLELAVGFSRMFENAHWPSDVAGGYLTPPSVGGANALERLKHV